VLNYTASGSIFPLDVSGTANFRGIVNPVTLTDGSVLSTAAPPLDFSNNFGVTWNPVVFDLCRNWQSVAISANGQYQTAVTSSTGYIWTSNNYGSNWLQNGSAPASNWSSIAISANGQYQTAGINSGLIYTSINFGQTWSNTNTVTTPGSKAFTSVAMSSTGQYQTSLVYGGAIFTSSNTGVTWVQNASAPTVSNWQTNAMSSTGQYQTAAIYGGFIYVSSNYGSTWTQNASAPSANWTSVAISATGQYQSADISGSYIYRSTDFGQTWSNVGLTVIPGNQPFTSIAMSANGQYQIAGAVLTSGVGVSGYLFTSTNFGANWKQIPSVAAIKSVAVSATGQYLAFAGSYNNIGSYGLGYLWSSTTPTNNMYISNGLTVSGPIAFNSPVNPIPLLDGTVLASNPVSIDVSGMVSALSLGLTTNPIVGPVNNTNFWYSISMSNNGQYQLATTYGATTGAGGGGAFISSNYGITWTQNTPAGSPNGQFVGGAISGTGQYQLLICYQAYMYVSTNYGASWTQTSSPFGAGTGYWQCCAVSATGQYMSAGVYPNLGAGNYVYVSSNYGVTWGFINIANIAWRSFPSISSYCIAMSANGQYQLTGTYGGWLYISSNYGRDWTSLTNSINGVSFFDVAVNTTACSVSPTGQYQILGTASGVFYSTNYGNFDSHYLNMN
jgi:hypothetical protein